MINENVIQLISLMIQAVTIYMLYRVYRVTKRVRRLRSRYSPAMDMISSIFASKPDTDTWKAWAPSGADAKWWVLNDGDNVQNEAVNIVQWIANNGIDEMLKDNGGVPAVTAEQIADKLTKAGYGETAVTFMELILDNQKKKNEHDSTQI